MSRSKPIIVKPKIREMAKYPMDRIPIDFLHLQGNFLKIMTDIYI